MARRVASVTTRRLGDAGAEPAVAPPGEVLRSRNFNSARTRRPRA